MDQQQATEFIIQELGRRRSHDEIIREICEQTGWPWKSAVFCAAQSSTPKPDRGPSSPLPIMLGIGSIIGGGADR